MRYLVTPQNISLNYNGMTHIIESSDPKYEKIKDAIDYFINSCKRCNTIAAHNISFDIRMIKNEMQRLGKVWEDEDRLTKLCTMKEWRRYKKERGEEIESSRLEYVYKQFYKTKKRERSHDGFEDTRRSKKIYERIM